MGTREPDGGIDVERLAELAGDLGPGDRPRRVRAALLGIVAAAGIVAPWVLLPDGDETDAKAGAPRATPTATATAQRTQAKRPPLVRYRVEDAVPCLRIRVAPGVENPEIDCVASGVTVDGRDRRARADGRIWLRVRSPRTRLWGWAAADYLEPARRR